jgi:hypothetical protein
MQMSKESKKMIVTIVEPEAVRLRVAAGCCVNVKAAAGCAPPCNQEGMESKDEKLLQRHKFFHGY